MRKKWISVLLFYMITSCCNAQTAGYKFYAPLDSVKASGFYNIAITPELSAHLKIDCSDLRIVNDSGRWVPHVLHYPVNEINTDALEMDIKFTKQEDAKLNTIVLIETGKEIISNFGLVIKNTAAERFCTLSGSDDNNNWFVINDSIKISPVADRGNTKNIFTIEFPPNNYKFYKIVVLNNNKDPFDIKGVVTTGAADIPDHYKIKNIENPEPLIEQKDSGKISYIKITQQQPNHFNFINLKITGVKYFSRKVDLFIPQSANHSFSSPGQLLQSFIVSNNSTLQYYVPLSNAVVFYLLVNNEDNLPVKVTQVNTSVYYHYITAYLEKGNSYKLIMGNDGATQPNYDLNNITEKLSDSIPFLSFQKINPFEQKQVVVTPVKNNKWILWGAIIAVLFILLLFTQKMVKEVNKRKEHDSI